MRPALILLILSFAAPYAMPRTMQPRLPPSKTFRLCSRPRTQAPPPANNCNKHGKDADIPPGTPFTAYVATGTPLSPPANRIRISTDRGSHPILLA